MLGFLALTGLFIVKYSTSNTFRLFKIRDKNETDEYESLDGYILLYTVSQIPLKF